jgi:monomeric sarcosine oxidase
MAGPQPSVDVVVIGAGLAGAASAWAAARRGQSVLIIEQFGPGHTRGSSHGSARIVRRAYGDELYVGLTGRAFELWREVEMQSERPLLRMYGGLDFGPRRSAGGVAGVAAALRAHGVAHERLDAADAAARWPGMRFEGEVIYHPQAGTMDAAGAVEALLELARGAGAEVRFETVAVRVRPDGAGARVTLADGSTVPARVVVVAAGAWLAPLLGGLVELPELTVTQQQVFHFPRRDPSQPPWPSVIHEGTGRAIYHLAGGRDGGPADDRKIGEHDGGSSTTASERDGAIDPASRARVSDYVRRWLPGLEPTPRGEASCLYTETPSEDFLLDRVGPIVICSPCSGHGAKFAPLIGELTADLVDGRGDAVPDRFRLVSHARPRAGGVSL